MEKFSYGYTSLNTKHNSNGKLAVNFGKTYSTPPLVFLSFKTSNYSTARYVGIQANNITTTGFEILWVNWNTASSGSDYSPDVYWFAIGSV